MADSSVKEEVFEKYAVEEQRNLVVTMSQTENIAEHYLDVRQRILLPNDYCPLSQIVKLKITLPKILIVNSEDVEESTESISEQNLTINKVHEHVQPHAVINEDKSIQAELKLKHIDCKTSTINFLEKERQYYKTEVRTKNSVTSEKYPGLWSPSLASSIFLREEKLMASSAGYTGSLIPPGKVQATIEAYKVLVDNKMPSGTVGRVARRSIEDLTRDRLAYPDTTVKAKVKFFEAELPLMPEVPNEIIAEEVAESPFEEKVQVVCDTDAYKKIEYGKLPFSANSPSYETLRKYLEGLNRLNEDEDSKLVKELVLSRFKRALQNFIEKSGRRRRHSLGENAQESLPLWRDSGNNSISGETLESSEDIFKSYEISTSTSYEESEMATYVIPPDENKCSEEKNVQKAEQFDEKTFLEMALGSELEDLSNTFTKNSNRFHQGSFEGNSIGTSNISELISSYDIYSSVDYKAKRNRQSVATYTSISNSREWTGHNTEITEISDVDTSPVKAPSWKVERDTEILMKEFNKQTSIISQASKALHLCQNRKGFYESIERVEAERVLLVATLRKEATMEEMAKVDYENINDQKVGCVRLSNIVIPLTWSSNNATYTRFFVCVFRCGSTVFSSSLLSPKEDMKLEVKECFYLEELPADFEITFRIYSMYSKVFDEDKTSGSSYKDCSHIFIKKLFSPRKKATQQNIDSCSLKKSSFILYGKGSIKRSSMKQGDFQIQNVFPRIPIANTLRCTVDSLAKLTNKMCGFLTVGEHKADSFTWNRQWCLLQATEIKFWDYPAQEYDSAPNKVIDLTRCSLQQITQANENSCSRPKTLYLHLGPESAQEEIYLSMDTQKDLTIWKKELNATLTALLQWDCLKKY